MTSTRQSSRGAASCARAARTRSSWHNLNGEMETAAAALHYEKGSPDPDQMAAITDLLERQKIVSPAGLDQDAHRILPAGYAGGVFVLFIRQGRIVGNQ